MKQFIYGTIALVAVMMASCVNDDTDLKWLIDNNPAVKPIDIQLDDSALDEGIDVIPTDPADEAYNDYWENSPWTTTVRVNYTAEGATVTGGSTRVKSTIEGGHVVLKVSSSRVHVIASGESADASLKIYSDYKFKLTLNGLNITNPNGAAINNQCGKTMYVVIAPETVNSLSDGRQYVYTEEEDMKGTFFSEGQVVISGSGELNVISTGRHGIATDDYIRVRKGSKISIKSDSGHCLRGKDAVYIDGSVLNLVASAPGSRGITSRGNVVMKGGRTTIITTGAPVVDAVANDTTSCAGVKSDSIMTVAGGELRIKSTGEGGKGINAHSDIVMTGGKVEIVTLGHKGLASPKGIKCEGVFNLSGGVFYSFSGHASPVSAKAFNVAPGYKLYDKSHTHLVQVEY